MDRGVNPTFTAKYPHQIPLCTELHDFGVLVLM